MSISTLNNWRREDFPNGSKALWLEFVAMYETNQYTPAEITKALETTSYTVYRFRCRYARKWPERAAERKTGAGQ